MKNKNLIHGTTLVLFISVLVACSNATPISTSTSVPTAAVPATQSAGHSMDMSAPFDATFIDGMIVHHQGAITMAQQALKDAQHPELKQLAEAIVKAQQTEIDQMKQWRSAWYPNLKDTGGMMMDMGPMTVGTDATQPFDIRFIDAMVPHHESAISMAKEAQQKAEHPEIKSLADAIIKAQTSEIDQMKQWKSTWAAK